MSFPQGSVFDPTLSWIYIYDIVSINSSVHNTFYAEDTTILLSEKSEEIFVTKSH